MAALRGISCFMSVEVGKVLEGKVISVMPFGAFVSLPEGRTGLVHISEVALDYVQNVSDHLKESDEVKVKVVSIDEKGKISLSIKKVMLDERKNNRSGGHAKKTGERSNAPVRPANVDWTANKAAAPELSFEDKMSKFKTDSDERMQDIKRSFDSKRSGGGYRRSSGSY